MRLLIDYRERNSLKPLIESLSASSKHNNAFNMSNLYLGDFQFVERDESGDEDSLTTYMIIERKTVCDLAASIKDGRYMEQKMRLLSKRQFEPHIKLAYIIEGDYSFSPGFTCANMNNKSLSGVIINSIVRDNIIVWTTKNMNDTNDLLFNLLVRFSDDPGKYFDRKRIENENPHCPVKCGNRMYASSVVAEKLHSVKKDNIDVQTCLEIQLSCIPGVSSKKAQSIIKDLNIKSMYDLGCLLKNEKEHNESITGKGKSIKKNILQSVNGIGHKLEDTIRTFVLG